MDDLPEPIHNARPVKVYARRTFVLQRVKSGAFAEHVESSCKRVPADRLEQWMTGCHPLQLLCFGGIAVRRAPRVTVGDRGELPVGIFLIAMKYGGRAGRIKSVRHARDSLQCERHELCCFTEKARDGLRNYAPLLAQRAPLDQHLKVGSCSRGPRVSFGRWRGTVPHLRHGASAPRGQHHRACRHSSHAALVRREPQANLADNVKYSVVVERVANLLQLFMQSLQDPTSMVLVATKLKIRQSLR